MRGVDGTRVRLVPAVDATLATCNRPFRPEWLGVMAGMWYTYPQSQPTKTVAGHNTQCSRSTARKVYADQRTPVTQQRVHQLPRVPQKYFCRRDGPQAGPQAPREGPARARRDRGRGGVSFLCPSSPTLTLFHRALHTTRHALPIARGDHALRQPWIGWGV